MFFLPLIILLLLAGSPLFLIPGGGFIWVLFAILIIGTALTIAIWTGIKVIWTLLKAFVNILLLTIFAPLQLAMGAIIPSFGFGQWLRSFASNLSVFIVTGALFLFSFLFIIEGIMIGFTGAVQDVIFALLKPLLGANHPAIANLVSNPAWPPLLGTGSGVWIGLLFMGVSFVLFTLTPKAAEIIQGLLSGKPFAYGTAIGEAFGGVGLAYGLSGARGQVDLARRGIEQQRLLKLMQSIEEERGIIGGGLARLSRTRAGRAAGLGGVFEDIRKGAEKH